MVPFYNSGVAFVDRAGKILRPWIQYLQQFTIAPPPIMSVSVDISPFAYIAKEPGNIVVSGGTVSAIVLTRGTTSIILFVSTANARIIPVSINDAVTVTFSVLPIIQFLPAYGQNTNV